MTEPKCPWQLTRLAVRRYRSLIGNIRGRAAVNETIARQELTIMAIDATTSQRVPKELDNGSIQYRGPSPLRLRLIVVPPSKHGTDLPALVDVLTDNEGRR